MLTTAIPNKGLQLYPVRSTITATAELLVNIGVPVWHSEAGKDVTRETYASQITEVLLEGEAFSPITLFCIRLGLELGLEAWLRLELGSRSNRISYTNDEPKSFCFLS